MKANRLIEEGVTYPIHCTLSNGIDAIVKYPRNHVGTEVLINEYIGNSIADEIGLTIPRYGVCDLSIDAILDSDCYDELSESNCGISFFSEFIPNTVPANDRLLSNSFSKETERIILFDLLICNEDRHEGNIICPVSDHSTPIFIDCSHILTADDHSLHSDLTQCRKYDDENLYNLRMLTDNRKNVYNKLCRTIGYKNDRLMLECKNIKEKLKSSVLDSIRSSIPGSWLTNNTLPRVNAMFEIIIKRLSILDRLTECIVKEREANVWKK